MITRHLPWNELLHEVVEYQGILYLAGIVAEDLTVDMTGQASDCMAQLERLLRAHGSDLGHVLQVTIYIADLAEKAAFDAVWRRTFPPAALPARAGIGVADLGPGVKVEIVAIAAKRGTPARAATASDVVSS
jgi:enamine deaminase RidA (YjgF/YER057c/UK114 family)